MGSPSMNTPTPERIADGLEQRAGDDQREMDVLGVPFTLCSFPDAVARVRDLIVTGRPHHVVLANAHTLNLACDDPAYRRVLRRADLVLRDGAGIELAARLAGADAGHNFVGTDFVPDLLAALGPAEVRVFLFGGRPGVTEQAADRLARYGQHVRVIGAVPGYGGFERVAQRIHAARPHVLLVALGNPLQEQWIDDHLARLGVPVAIGVGALFDYLGGRVPRAPRWVLRMRAEWVFRLLVEPRRLWRRYVMGNPRFVWRLISSRRREPW
jgi:exopolysaccharide biosynthesis WecB/TagA/CpsF family protein